MGAPACLLLLLAFLSSTATLAASESRCSVTPDVQNPVTGAPVTTLHPSGVNSDPFVLYEAGRFRMWYTVPTDETNMLPLGIAYAESEDGSHWTVRRKDGTTGSSWDDYAFLKPAPGSWNALGVETASVVKGPDGRYFLYYTGDLPPAGSHVHQIGLAVSTDGIHWTPQGTGPVFSAANAWEQTVCDVISDPTTCVGGVGEPSVLYDAAERQFKMWYAGLGPKNGIVTFRIGYATSPDGIAWTRQPEPVFDRGGTAAWDELWASHTNVVRDGSGQYHLFYFGTAAADYCPTCDMQPGSIGHASSADGIVWQRDPANPLLSPKSGGWSAWTVGGPDALFMNGTLELFYFGQATSGGAIQIGRASGSCAGASGTTVQEQPLRVRVFPNPARSDRGHSLVVFDNLEPGAKVKVFTVSGFFVRKLDVVAYSTRWDLLNDGGEAVASGIYLYVAETPDGRRARGVVTVIR